METYKETTELTFNISGLEYYQANDSEAREGLQVRLKHEPENEYSTSACEIYLFGKKLGYVPESLTLTTPIIDHHKHLFVITKVTKIQGNIVSVEVTLLWNSLI